MAIFLDIPDVELACNNAGGIVKLQVIAVDAISFVAHDVLAEIVTAIELKAGASWAVWNVTKKFLEFQESQETDNKHGDYFSQTLDFSIAKDDRFRIQLRRELRNNYVAVLYTDTNGVTKFIPKLKVAADFTTGKLNEKNYYQYQLKYKAQLPAFVYAPIIIIPAP